MATCETCCNHILKASVKMKPYYDCCVTPAPAQTAFEGVGDMGSFDFTYNVTTIQARNTAVRGFAPKCISKVVSGLTISGTYTCLKKSNIGQLLLATAGDIAAGTLIPFSFTYVKPGQEVPLPDIPIPGTVVLTGLTATDWQLTENGTGIRLLNTTAVNALTAGATVAGTLSRAKQVDYQLGNANNSYATIWVDGIDEISGLPGKWIFNKVSVSASGATSLIAGSDTEFQSFAITGDATEDQCADVGTLIAGQQPSRLGSFRTTMGA